MTEITKEACVQRDTCRVSGGPLRPSLNLGEIYLNDFIARDDELPGKYPLELMYCEDSGLVQLRHSVDPELMFRTYWYNSGTNEAMAEHLRQVVMDAVGSWASVQAGDTVVDIGCNDGTLLDYYSSSVYTVGFDPARNLRTGRMNEFINEFFSSKAFWNSRKPVAAKVVTSIAMFYDVEDPKKFAGEVFSILDRDGVWVLEMHYLPKMLSHNEVDAICHEHLSYFSLTSLKYVLSAAGFDIVDVQLNDVNGGSMLVYAKKSNTQTPISNSVTELLEKEGMTSLQGQLQGFSDRVKSNKEDLRTLLEQITKGGKKVFGYGASTKGNTLLQYCGIGPDLIPYIADRNPAKWGRKTVGTDIPIISEEEARLMGPDYFLALPYHFLENFNQREKAFLQVGGKFISPVPVPHIIQ